MEIQIYKTKEEMGQAAAVKGAQLIRAALKSKGSASIIVATGASQFEMLSALTRENIDWTRVTAFHLDEYIGIPLAHPASFRKYLKERFADHIPIKAFHYINGEVDPAGEIERLNSTITPFQIDVAFIGVGENAHLAFNDPPADFTTTDPYIEVQLDNDCRQQQINEGWFTSMEEMPERAISMSVNHILKSDHIICTVPGERKAIAVKKMMESKISEDIPATALKSHHSVSVYLDRYSSISLPRL